MEEKKLREQDRRAAQRTLDFITGPHDKPLKWDSSIVAGPDGLITLSTHGAEHWAEFYYDDEAGPLVTFVFDSRGNLLRTF